jgi:penicillin-binding protein 2
MYLRSDERPPQMSSGFSLRVAIMGGLALAMFAVIFFRLWYLQVLSGDRYLAEANDNRTREVRVVAPRGEILDRDGEVLVRNRTSLALQVNPQKLPRDQADRRALLAELADVARIPLRELRLDLREQLKISPSAPVTLEQDVESELVYFLEENKDRFPGVEIGKVFVRRYPHGTLAAHLFGNVGEVSEEELKEGRYRSLEPGDMIGKDGVEYEYDRYLRGRSGATRIQVDSFGRPKGELSVVEPEPGDHLQLTIDADLQEAGEAALSSQGLPGAFVAMDVHNGEVLAMGSSPTFDPADLISPSQEEVDAIYRDPVAAPIVNRAISGLYPTGSTFKPITSVAALANDAITPDEIIVDDGAYTLGGITFQNAGGAAYGPIAMQAALQVSSDVFYYTLGDRMNDNERSGPLQRWARRLGIGRPTGIDLPAEATGLLPTPDWRNDLFEKELTDRLWSAGDNVNLAVGQGDLQADPLQMAVAYATIANGGTVVRPHLGEQVESVTGEVLEEIRPAPKRQVSIDDRTRSTIMGGLTRAAMETGGTSYPVFGNFPFPVAGKTGTAERGLSPDQSWYVAVAPADDPQIVVAVTIERGGFGVDAAAPVAARMLENYFKLPITPAVPVSTKAATQE